MSTTDRVNSMSPAAQRLVSKKLGIKTNADKALRASYSPSPTRHSGDRTPISLTPSGTPKSRSSTPSSGSRTPGSDRRTPKRDGSDISSLTDNLLQLPKRPKAQDFFWSYEGVDKGLTVIFDFKWECEFFSNVVARDSKRGLTHCAHVETEAYVSVWLGNALPIRLSHHPFDVDLRQCIKFPKISVRQMDWRHCKVTR